MRWTIRGVALGALLLAGCLPKRAPQEGLPPGLDPVEAARRHALYQVSILEAARPLGPEGFAPFLKYQEPSVRAAAVLGVGRAGEALAFAGGDPAPFVSAILELAGDPAGEVRRSAAAALGLIGPAASGKIEAPWQAEASPEVKVHWVRAAGRIAPTSGSASPEITMLGQALSDDGSAAASALALGVWALRTERAGGKPELPAEVLAALVGRFRTSLGERRIPFAYALWRLHPPSAIDEIRQGLVDPDARVRALSARALGDTVGASGAREVARMLRDSNVWTRVEASRALAKLGDADRASAADLVEMLESADPPVASERGFGLASPHAAVAACEALGTLGFRETADALRSRLQSDDVYVFAAAASAYAKVLGVAALPDLAENLGDHSAPSDWRFRMGLAGALAGLARPKSEKTAPTGKGGAIPGDAEDLLQQLLGDADARVQAAALDSYAELAGAGSRDRLIAVLSTAQDVSLVQTAADRLAKLGPDAGPAAGSALLAAFSRFASKDPDLAAQLAESVGKLSGAAAVPALEAAAQSPDNALMLAADKALRALGRTPPARTSPPQDLPSEAEWVGDADVSHLTIRTPKGEVVVELASDSAPLNMHHLLALVRKGFFRGVAFHRVVPAFVVQGGDPHGDGNGGPETSVPCELSDLPYERGTVGMALAGRDTGGSQFFFTLTPQPHLEGNYTVLGRVVRGMAVVDRLTVGDPILEIEPR